MKSALSLTLIGLCMSVSPRAAAAQQDLHSVFVAGRLGGHVEESDPSSGRSVGAGGSFDFFFTDRWALDVEAWIPASITTRVSPPGNLSKCIQRDGGTICGASEPGELRDLLFGVSALRRFGGNGIHPYVLVGFVVSRIENRTSTEHWTASDGAPQTGVGLVIPLSNRLAVAPEIRTIIFPFWVVLRPSVALVYRLR